MQNIIILFAHYSIIVFMILYTYQSFSYFGKKTDKAKKRIVLRQIICIFLVQFAAYLSEFLITGKESLILFYGCQVIYFILTVSLYHIIYPSFSRMLISHMCMLLNLGFIILTRLSYTNAVKQFIIAAVGTIITGSIPFIMNKMKFLRKMAWVYGITGIVLLLAVLLIGPTSNGAKLFISILGFSFQPSEFVKIVYVFFIAAMFEENSSLSKVFVTSIIAAIHILILVASKDLGGALIFSLIYVIMLYVATKNSFYLFGTLGIGCVAAAVAYRLFDHVQTRVTAWIDPWSIIDGKGYQVTQSLFAIGTGGWFGAGLYQGEPQQIPVVEQDFIFSAITEELGGIVGFCIILICLGCLILFLNIALQSNNSFYKFMATGLAVTYGIQVFLTIGGAIKLIPSTGVTLPLVSYGGSSIISTLILFAIVQGLYIAQSQEE